MPEDSVAKFSAHEIPKAFDAVYFQNMFENYKDDLMNVLEISKDSVKKVVLKRIYDVTYSESLGQEIEDITNTLGSKAQQTMEEAAKTVESTSGVLFEGVRYVKDIVETVSLNSQN